MRNEFAKWEIKTSMFSGRKSRVGNCCDFAKKDLGKVIPYGVYDQTTNAGWVSVGIDHDTAEFAVETLRRWWRKMGSKVYPRAQRLLITADGGGSNGRRCRLWKVELQRWADEIGLRISVCHFPPGTSKWNKSEHRMFCHIRRPAGRDLPGIELPHLCDMIRACSHSCRCLYTGEENRHGRVHRVL